ncbi:MAG TPA: PilT/PilU family type 4a pilus ATPase, partial [Myxococcota bacterium]|nr:PilT/PilU family type 4a pilus ATPase [Myxococcota bacterium]
EPIPGTQTLSASGIEAILYEILTAEQRQTFDTDHDLDFAYNFGVKARFRGNYMMKTTGMGAVFRVIPTKILTLEQLNLPEAIRKLAESRVGLVLVTGPTGSGKSTTLASMIDFINKARAGHILTVEDPVEFVHKPQKCQVTHREVGRDVPSFQDAMRSAGREDADVILVGELRGAETMKLALQAASSGVLVFATVHTNSAPATVDRFINAFPSEQQPAIRGMLAECLTGIVAQQLLKKADGKGRVAVQEILIGNRAVSSIIREGKTMMLPSLIQSGRAEGMQSMDDTLLSLVKDGTIKAADALAKSVDKETFGKNPVIVKAVGEPVEGAGH